MPTWAAKAPRGGSRCPRGAGLVWVSIGLVYRRPRNSGRTCRHNPAHELGEVAGGVEIAIEHETALIAAECPFGQAQFGFHHATGRTGLGGRVPAVRDVHGAPGPTGFVLDLASEFAPADTGDAPGEAPVFQHAGDVEVLDHDRAVGPRESGGEL